MAGIESGIYTILTYADNDTHGYELRERNYDIGTDCAGLGRMYAAAVEGADLNTYPEMHSWDIADVLGGRGWDVINFSESAKKRGDILARVDPTGGTGHVVIYLGDDRICEAANNYDGKRGDSSGKEIHERSYYSYGYKYIIRPKEVPTVSIEAVSNGVYRMYNPNSGQHHFTASHNEAESLASIGWTYEGVGFKSGDGANVYRLYNPFGGQHFLTTNAEEGMSLAIAHWVVESVAFKAGETYNVYRLYNPNNGDHLYSTSSDERHSLVNAGWHDEGIAFKAN